MCDTAARAVAAAVEPPASSRPAVAVVCVPEGRFSQAGVSTPVPSPATGDAVPVDAAAHLRRSREYLQRLGALGAPLAALLPDPAVPGGGTHA